MCHNRLVHHWLSSLSRGNSIGGAIHALGVVVAGSDEWYDARRLLTSPARCLMCKSLLALIVSFSVAIFAAADDRTPPAKPATPLTITVVGDSIILRCEDRETLNHAQQMLALLAAEAATPVFESV